MVFSGDKRDLLSNKESEMDRIKPLHNFDLPCLKWGNQKLLRCMKVESKGDVSVHHRRKKPSVIGTRRRLGSSNDRSFYKFPSSEKLKATVSGYGSGDGEIEATREKLMFDFQTEVGKMKDAIFKGSYPSPATVTVTTPANETTSCSPAEKPWNLRTRRSACKSPTRNGDVTVLQEGDKTPAGDISVSGERKEREKFAVSLSRREVEEDFTAMTGRRLPRKPKKRPRVIQRQLDTLFPGLWLSEITADLYRAPDDNEATGKG